MAGEEAPRGLAVELLLDREGVLAHDVDDLVAHLRRVAQPVEDGARQLGRFVGVRGAGSVGRFAEVVQQQRQPHLERRVELGSLLDRREDVLVDGHALPRGARVVADRRLVLGDDRRQDAGVARQPQGLRRLRAEQQLRELAASVRCETAADPLARDEAHLRGPLPHLGERGVVGLEVELRDEAQAADDPQRVVAEARRRRRAEHLAAEVALAVERVEQLPGLEPLRDRVDREVAALHVLLERDGRVGDDLEVVAARARSSARPAAARTRSPPGERDARPGRGQQARADVLAGDDEVLDLPVRLERRAQLGMPTPGTTKSVSRIGLPSISSRTAPPTIQASSPSERT